MTAPKGDKPAQQPNAAGDENDPDDVQAQNDPQEPEKPAKAKKLGKDLVAGLEHLAGSELVKVRVVGPVVVRRDPETGRVREHRRGSDFYISRKELDTMNVSGVRSKSLRVLKKDEDEDED